MVHASVRAVGPVHGGPDEIHHAVLDAVAPSGTVMMYVGCQDGFDDVGRGIYTAAQEGEILQHQPPFDPQSSRASRDFGVLSEFFRSHPDTVCSDAVDSRVADHPLDYDVGRGTPYDRFVQAGGQVLLLGSRYDEVTLLHYVEHVADISDRRVVRFQVPLLRDGARTWVTCEQYDTSGDGVHPNWPHDFFARIIMDFVAKHQGTAACSVGPIGKAPSVRMDAQAFVAHAIPIMQRQAAQREPVL